MPPACQPSLAPSTAIGKSVLAPRRLLWGEHRTKGLGIDLRRNGLRCPLLLRQRIPPCNPVIAGQSLPVISHCRAYFKAGRNGLSKSVAGENQSG